MINKLIIQGNSKNNQIFDGNGETLIAEKAQDAIIVQSVLEANKWLVPENITIKNYKIKGAIRIYGQGMNGQGELVKQSSYNKNHTELCQQAAPRNIVFENLQIEANERIPFYVGPGCTSITLKKLSIFWPFGSHDGLLVL